MENTHESRSGEQTPIRAPEPDWESSPGGAVQRLENLAGDRPIAASIRLSVVDECLAATNALTTRYSLALFVKHCASMPLAASILLSVY